MKRTKETKAEVVKVKFDSTNEIVVIAAVVLDEDARKKYLNLPPEYFFGPSHAEMWTALQELYRQGLEYSTEAVRSIAGEKFDAGVLEEYVASFGEKPPSNLKHHIKMLRWDKTRHEAAKGVVPLFIDALRDNAADPERVMSLAKQVAGCFTGASDLRYMRDGLAIAREHSKELTERRLGIAVYKFGFDALDLYTEDNDDWEVKKGDGRMIPGMAPGLSTALTGISGHGKTTFTANLLIKQTELKRKILWGAWEQMPGMSLEKAAVVSLGWSLSEVKSGRYTEEEQKELEEEMEKLSEFLKFFELPFGRSRGEKNERFNDQNLDLIHQYVAESGCNIFIGDVFKYALREFRPDDESQAIKRMNAIAKDCRCHVMLVHHLNLKDLERRQDKRPTRDVVMGSSGWINDVDNAISTHCPGLYGVGKNDKMEIHILKQRDGRWPQVVEMDWAPRFGYISGGKTLDINLNDLEGKDFLDYEPRNTDRSPSGKGYRKKNR